MTATKSLVLINTSLWARRSIWALLVLLGIVATPALAADRNYTIIRGDQTIGAMVVQADAREEHVRYAFSTNGRGPTLEFQISLDPRGLPSAVTVTGSNFIGIPVNETLTSAGNALRWVTSVDQGEGSAGAFYLPTNDLPEMRALLARALSGGPEAGLPLLPNGRARLSSSSEHRLTIAGQSRTLKLVFVEGVSLAPLALWLNEQGQLFAEISPTGATIARGSESAVAEMRELQNQASDARYVSFAARMSSNAPSSLLIRGANVFDADAKRMIPPASVLTSGNRIVAVGPEADRLAPAGVTVVDGSGATLLPGFWDMHVHLQSNVDGLLHLANGVTTVRDMGNDVAAVTTWRRRYASGELLGPRVLLAGLIDGRSPTATAGVQVSTAEELSRAITMFADDGYLEIKTYSSFPTSLLPQAIAQSHALGLAVVGHVPAGLRMDDVVRLGYDGVSHLNFVLLNFLGDEVQARTNTLARMLEPANRSGAIDLNSLEVARSIALWRSHHIWIDPTAVVLENLFSARRGEMRAAYAAFGDRLPPAVARNGLDGGLARTEADQRTFANSFALSLRLLKRIHDAGIPIVPGTDGEAGILFARELELYVMAGIPPLDVLQLATLIPARIMRRDADLGSIAPGKLADLVLVDGDPSANISDVRNVRAVIRNGVLYSGPALQEAVGIRRRPR